MDKNNNPSTPSTPTYRDSPITLKLVTDERSGDLQAVIEWLENTFRATPPDDLVTARIRRKLIQEWKSRKLVHAMTLFVAWVGVGSLFLMLAAALTGGGHSDKKA